MCTVHVHSCTSVVEKDWLSVCARKCHFSIFARNSNLNFQLYFALSSGWSGTGPFERWAQANYNMLFSALAPLAIGLFDRTATAETQLKYPELYKLSQDREAFSVKVLKYF